MKLYLLRHALAVDHGTPGVSEDERPLTPEGAVKMRAAAAGMKRLGLEFDAVLTSPLLRARQTADIVASVYGGRILLKEISALKPGEPAPKLWSALKPYARMPRVLLVGHEPSLSELVSTVLIGRPRALSVDFKKGGLCFLEIDGIPPKSSGLLHWLMTNKQLRMTK